MSKSTAIVWLRNDLRLQDNPALRAARQFDQILPLVIFRPASSGQPGAASRVWLHHSLNALNASLKAAGSELIVRAGNPSAILKDICAEANAGAVFWNRCYDPDAVQRDAQIEKALKDSGVHCESFAGNLLLEPWESRKKDNTPYLVFTPFAKSCFEKLHDVQLTPAMQSLPQAPHGIKAGTVDSLRLLPDIRWDESIVQSWEMGEKAAHTALRRFLNNGLTNYDDTRNFPAIENGVSRLSAHLHFGEISPRQVWTAVTKKMPELQGSAKDSATTFLKEILWREFSHHLLYHFPDMPSTPLRREFERYPWSDADESLTAWQRGMTGFPIVDAGMRQLWQTGWMHNRVRMIVGSFLIKDLGIDWRTGEEWFCDTLVDADLAQNAMNWQWVAGCGADASPFFRIFNPTTQGKKFDPDGDYIRKYVPELATLPAKWIHAPHEAPQEVLQKAGVKPGETYPLPIVDHTKARAEALANYKRLR